MLAEDEPVSLVWPSIGLAALVLIGLMMGWGLFFPPDGESPGFIASFANGATALPQPYYLIPALIIGVGCGLSTRTVFESVLASLPGIFLMGIAVVIVIQGGAVANLGRADTDFKMTGAIIGLIFSTPVFLGLIAVPIIFFSASFAILLHLIASLVNPEHRDWLVDREKIKMPEGQVFDAGAGLVLVIGTAWYFLGGALNLAVMGPPTAEMIMDDLDPLVGVAQITTENGRKSVQKRLVRLRQEYESATLKPCDRKARSWLATTYATYFRSIRNIEDWKPGQELSEYSQEALRITAMGLRAGIVTYDELKPYVQIHLNREEWAPLSQAARQTLNCTS